MANEDKKAMLEAQLAEIEKAEAQAETPEGEKREIAVRGEDHTFNYVEKSMIELTDDSTPEFMEGAGMLYDVTEKVMSKMEAMKQGKMHAWLYISAALTPAFNKMLSAVFGEDNYGSLPNIDVVYSIMEKYNDLISDMGRDAAAELELLQTISENKDNM